MPPLTGGLGYCCLLWTKTLLFLHLTISKIDFYGYTFYLDTDFMLKLPRQHLLLA